MSKKPKPFREMFESEVNFLLRSGQHNPKFEFYWVEYNTSSLVYIYTDPIITVSFLYHPLTGGTTRIEIYASVKGSEFHIFTFEDTRSVSRGSIYSIAHKILKVYSTMVKL